jgi:DNA ligase-1
MPNVINALEAIEGAAQGNARLQAIRDNDSPRLRRLLTLALSPDITFGVKKLPKPVTSPVLFDDIAWDIALESLLQELENRRLTGNAAQEAIASFLGKCTLLQSKWAERIIKQDLRMNVGAKDVNNALGETVIYIFEVPLAASYDDVKEKDLAGTWALQPKLDGGRAVAILPGSGGRVKLLSRTGKEWGNFESIRLALQAWNDKRGTDETLYLDGEVVSLDANGRINFQQIQKTMMRKDGVEVGRLQYVIFDAATAQEWQDPQLPYSDRYNVAAATAYAISGTPTLDEAPVAFVPSTFTKTLTMADLKEVSGFWVGKGYEGAMARRADAPVKNKRSKALLKVKTFKDAEARILGKVEGQGKYTGMLGAFRCQYNGKEFEIGSGFDDNQRQEFWEMAELPELVNFKFFELTDDAIPRFPIFRYFRSVDDVSA